MSKQQQHLAALDVLADLPPDELARLQRERHTQKLRDDEMAKKHPLCNFRMPKKEWDELKAHLMDGGGVVHDHDLARDIMQAVFDDNQEIFWAELPHLLKARSNINGHIRKLQNGGVSFTGQLR